MLKKWYPLAAATSFWPAEYVEVDVEELVPTWYYEGNDAPTINEKLLEKQKVQLADLWTKFRTMMSGKYGWTTVCQHHIGVRGCQQPYRLPHTYRVAVERKIEIVLAECIIEPCSSECMGFPDCGG